MFQGCACRPYITTYGLFPKNEKYASKTLKYTPGVTVVCVASELRPSGPNGRAKYGTIE